MRRPSTTAALALSLLALGLAACGADEEQADTGATTSGADTTATAPERTGTATDAESERSDDHDESGGLKAPPADSGESGEDGAGDEIPASSQVLVTGRGGRLRPDVVHVAPFIAIRVELRSVDGVEYELEGAGKRLKAGGEIETASTTFAGLRNGERLVLSGPQGKVTVQADAEPGP